MVSRRYNHNSLTTYRPVVGGAMMALVVAVIGSVAFAAPSGDVHNEWCPVMADEKIDPAITVVYRGKVVAFCCDTCVKKFRANPAKYESRLPQFAEPGHATDGQARGATEHDHSGLIDHGGGEEPDQSQLPLATGHNDGAEAPGDEREPLLGRLHPMVIHFPIAGMPLALAGFLAWVLSGRDVFARSDAIPLFVATLASIAAVVTGNIAHDSMRFSESLQQVVTRHQLVSTAVMVIAICLSAVRLWRWDGLWGKWRWVYGGGLAIVCALLGYTGFLGGSLVFGLDHLAW